MAAGGLARGAELAMLAQVPSSAIPLPPASAFAASPAVHQINVSDGGVPKLPIPRARIELDGVVGDRQADRRYHGSPDQALCLYGLELIEALSSEGHPIAPGNVGENLTTRGLDWSRLELGTKLRIGRVLIEITDHAVPCSKNARYFRDRAFQRMSHKIHPGWSRLYARVLEPGRVATGDGIEMA